jgi:hypothetical protein
MDKMANWPSVLTQFQKMVNTSEKTVGSPSLELSTPLRIMDMISRNKSTRNYTAIEANFLYAAMHIACMRELQFRKDTCPDLPEALDGLFQYVVYFLPSGFILRLFLHRKSLSASNQHDVETIKALFDALQQSKEGVSYMRAPLQLALLISPIYLLLPIQHFKKSYNRNTMLSIGTCLGNAKPPLILDVEKAIWKTLFSIASGTVDPFDQLHQLSQNLPWDRIQASSTDSSWFDLGKSSPLLSMKKPFAHVFCSFGVCTSGKFRFGTIGPH